MEFLLGVFSFQNLSTLMGKYGDVDSAIKQAQVIQEDLLREEAYGKNNYYLGNIDGSLSNISRHLWLFLPLFLDHCLGKLEVQQWLFLQLKIQYY